MAVVMISSMNYGGRTELADTLARQTGWPLLHRDDLLEKARDQGIKIGRLEVSIIKHPGVSERLAREKELYLAFLTTELCERSREGNLVYCGRAGHLLLPGVSHRLRVGLSIPYEDRVLRASQALKISLDKAESFLEQLDQDRAKWIRQVHGINPLELDQYDVFFNLAQMSTVNAAHTICAMAGWPDFQPTPVGSARINNLYLESRAKLRLALDPRTAAANFQVQADSGVVTVSYNTKDEPYVDGISGVLGDLEDCKSIVCTMAETNILWVQERFEKAAQSFEQITRLAKRWGAAVELLRLAPSDQTPAAATSTGETEYQTSHQPADKEYTGGVEDDDPTPTIDDGGLGQVQEDLTNIGQFGGQHTVYSPRNVVLETAQREGNYSLVVIGDIALDKGESAQTRMRRELALDLRDRLKAPVITIDELKAKSMVGIAQVLKLVLSLLGVVVIYFLVFHFQEPVLDFLGGAFHERWKWLTSVGVVLIVPLVAYLYGSVTGLVLKLVNID